MTVAQWTLAVEIVGAVGIIATLLYLAVQIRKETDRALSDKLMVALQRWVNVQSDAMRTEEGVAFLRRALHNYRDATPDEQGRFHSIMIEAIAAYHSIWDLHRRRLIDPKTFGAIEGFLVGLLKTRGGLQYWDWATGELPPDLVQRISTALETSEHRAHTETWSVFRGDGIVNG